MNEEKEFACIAIYDVRGIQDYIFKTNALKEIIGASTIVDNLIINQFQKSVKEEKLKEEEVILNWQEREELQFDTNTNIKIEILYYGGGNLVALFRSNKLCEKISMQMSKNIIKKAYGLSLVYCYVPKTEDYLSDWNSLKLKLSEIKATTPLNKPAGLLPIIQYDNITGLPLSKTMKIDDKIKKISYEAYQKNNAYNNIEDTSKYMKKFDDMRTSETEGLIAVVHIDGNSMGQNIGKIMKETTTYKEATLKMRKISNSIHEVFEKKALQNIEDKMSEICKRHDIKYQPGNKMPFRPIIKAGDDITFVCNARLSLDIVKEYLSVISKGHMYSLDYPFSACAGIAIIHSHFPFSKAYEMAEECCSNAKKRAKSEFGMLNGNVGNFVDFQYCYLGNMGDLSYIRKEKYQNIEGKKLLKRPYGLDSKYEEYSLNTFEKELQTVKKISRNKAKELRDAYYKPTSNIVTIVKRLKARNKNFPIKEEELYLDNDVAKYYDALEFLDLYAVREEVKDEVPINN